MEGDSERGTPISLRVVENPNVAETIKLFRSIVDLPMGEIRQSLSEGTEIHIGLLFALDHDEFTSRLSQFLNQLEEVEVKYELLVDGEPESRVYLYNIIERWHEIGIETQITTDLELGEPDIETLKKMKERWSAEVFRATLEQIARRDGYEVDEETLNWVKSELGD
jgi:hypothetical protein